MSKQRFFFLVGLSILLMEKAFSQSPVTVKTLLSEMTDASTVAQWPQPDFIMKQASSYDRLSVDSSKAGWFANGDFNQFIRKEEKNGHIENVMMDADGPGAIVRFWLTTVVKPGVLRFYVDNQEKPVLEIPAFDLLKAGLPLGPALLNPHSSYEANGKGGNTLYFPIPYQKHCKITFQFADTVSAKTSHYYQINYRTYTAGTKVQTFSKADLINYKADIDKAEAVLWNPIPAANGTNVNLGRMIKPKDSCQLTLPNGNAVINYLSVNVHAANGEHLATTLRSVIVKIIFDGQQTVWCPLGDFFGSGYGGKMIKSWYRELTKDGTIISRWVMPYQKNASITFINKDSLPVGIDVKVNVGAWKWDDASMYFHATYKYEANIKDAKWNYDVNKIANLDTAAPIEWNFVKIKGKGIYLGNTLAVNNHMQTWYGEGDAKVWVDDDKFPSEFGTGLEDYYNTSWAPVVLYQTPFANAPRADNANSFGHNTFTRTRNLDGIPFTKSFVYNLEMLSWDGGTIDAAATVYWYGAAGAKD
ncbi:MAG: DUF2961 domain-containing protein [Chitinophagaceae bacterium]